MEQLQTGPCFHENVGSFIEFLAIFEEPMTLKLDGIPSIEQIDQACEVFYNQGNLALSNPDAINQAHQLLFGIVAKDSLPNLNAKISRFQFLFQVLSCSKSPFAKIFCLTGLTELVEEVWIAVHSNEGVQLWNYLRELLIYNSRLSDTNWVLVQSCCRAYCRLIRLGFDSPAFRNDIIPFANDLIMQEVLIVFLPHCLSEYF